MPYYVFRVRPFAQYEKQAECAGFAEASTLAKSLRGRLAPGGAERVRVMFAESEDQAIDLMCQPRAAGPSGDD